MTEQKSEMLDIYIDESHTAINGEPILVYSLVIPRNLEDSIRDWMEVKDRYNLAKEVELKWALKHSDPKLKAEVKDEMISRLASGFLCMVSITKGRDKDLAFVNALKQAAMYAQDQGKEYLNIFYDRDAFTSQQIVRAEINSWTDLHCTTLASLNSHYSVAIQFADILAGVFNYIINVAFGKPVKQIEISDETIEEPWEITLDQLFRTVLRYSMWGCYPNQDDEDFGTVQEELNCFGTGIMVHGDFTDEEMKTFEELSWFYQGCLH
jgi:hypothetical protein